MDTSMNEHSASPPVQAILRGGPMDGQIRPFPSLRGRPPRRVPVLTGYTGTVGRGDLIPVGGWYVLESEKHVLESETGRGTYLYFWYEPSGSVRLPSRLIIEYAEEPSVISQPEIDN